MLKMLGAPFWARLGIVTLLFLSGAAPLHLADEVHAALPASASHPTAQCDNALRLLPARVRLQQL